ncbi:hypothetical protein KUCAC02_024011, partial [Chaenocephalus aceratus]
STCQSQRDGCACARCVLMCTHQYAPTPQAGAKRACQPLIKTCIEGENRIFTVLGASQSKALEENRRYAHVRSIRHLSGETHAECWTTAANQVLTLRLIYGPQRYHFYQV